MYTLQKVDIFKLYTDLKLALQLFAGLVVFFLERYSKFVQSNTFFCFNIKYFFEKRKNFFI